MATRAPKVPKKERQETSDAVERKAEALAEQIRRSKHFIVFTGAGVSTSAGIADFRGPKGVWTLEAQGREDAIESGDTLQAIPTATHMALVELQNQGILKYLVSQNCDGLHRKSGIVPDHISELHGNSNLEYCKDCGKQYLRDFYAVAPDDMPATYHETGRKCALCGGILLDTIINFGELLPKEPLKLARQHARKADLCLVLGSSLTVPPACNIPETAGQSHKASLVICNLQDTPLDELAEIRIHAKTDELMVCLMGKLELPIPSFALRRRLVVEGATSTGGRFEVKVRGVDVDGTPASFLQSVKCANNRRVVRAEPFDIDFRSCPEAGTEVNLELQFMGHYGEPNLKMKYTYWARESEETVYGLEYDPATGHWVIHQEDV
ncbi:hypothetical protein N0V93_005136 [Gnomoniopsis smithogilvyi]|uniref:protein acetyllysine N-acetyltransferase n=1 Tax=Gnomoniopsis smithogilvyi TaxID=1191159 RepID=A0A9W9CWV2_9PEZI|nr:hypothetical protein N0V93_005136 [Gnomoniopsis smithogilvyi]